MNKKMYITPNTEEMSVVTTNCMTGSQILNNNGQDGTSTAPIIGGAPARGVRSILIVGPKPF